MPRKDKSTQADQLKTGAYYQQPRSSGRMLTFLGIAVTLAFLSFVAYDSLASDSGFQQIEKLELELEEARMRLQVLDDEALELQTSIEQLRNNPTAVEAVAREQLGFILPGEKVFVLKSVPEVPLVKR